MPYFSLSFVDAYGRQASKRIEVEELTLLADYQAAATAIAGDLAAITDLGLLRMDLVISMGEDFAVTAGANRDTGATFSGYLYGGEGKKASWKLPGIKPAKVDADGSIDITDTEVKAMLDRFLQASGNLMLSDGEQIDSWISGTLDR
jgi:hypothetical protein